MALDVSIMVFTIRFRSMLGLGTVPEQFAYHVRMPEANYPLADRGKPCTFKALQANRTRSPRDLLPALWLLGARLLGRPARRRGMHAGLVCAAKVATR